MSETHHGKRGKQVCYQIEDEVDAAAAGCAVGHWGKWGGLKKRRVYPVSTRARPNFTSALARVRGPASRRQLHITR